MCLWRALLIAALAGALLTRADVDTEFRTNDWTGSGAVAALASALVLLLAYLFGGYVAGRMARRRGALHGLAVAVLSLLLGAVIGAVVGGLTDDQDVEDNLRASGSRRPPTRSPGSLAGIAASLAAYRARRDHRGSARRALAHEAGPAGRRPRRRTGGRSARPCCPRGRRAPAAHRAGRARPRRRRRALGNSSWTTPTNTVARPDPARLGQRGGPPALSGCGRGGGRGRRRGPPRSPRWPRRRRRPP